MGKNKVFVFSNKISLLEIFELTVSHAEFHAELKLTNVWINISDSVI